MSRLPIIDELKRFNKKKYLKFFMPGHSQLEYKNNFSTVQKKVFDIFKDFEKNIYSYDITEVNNFDNLSNPSGIIKKSQDILADDFNAKNAYFLVNGSTVGILSMISSVVNLNDKIIIQKNSHKSVHNACKINFLNTVYIECDKNENFDIYNKIDIYLFEKLLSDNRDAKAVVITSPDYYGQNQYINQIANISHSYNMLLIVDSAHAPHYTYGKEFGDNPIAYGADMAVISFHKTLPSINQTAVLLTSYNLNENISNILHEKINIFQTTSPSYILLANIELCNNVMKRYGEALYKNLNDAVREFKKKIYNSDIIEIDILDNDDFSRIVISSDYIIYIYNYLKNCYNIIPEMLNSKSIVLIANIFHTKSDFDKLYTAMEEIFTSLSEYKKSMKNNRYYFKNNENASLKFNKKLEALNYLRKNIYTESKKTFYLYPPGLPLIMDKEFISTDKISEIEKILFNDDIDIIS